MMSQKEDKTTAATSKKTAKKTTEKKQPKSSGTKVAKISKTAKNTKTTKSTRTVSSTKTTNTKTVAPKSSPKESEVKREVVTEKYIDPKNYLYALLILVGGILLVLYIFQWYNVKKEERLMTSYLISSNTIETSINDLSSLSQIRQESPTSYFIYLSYTGDEDVYNLEKDLKRVIDRYKLNDIFYYVDLTYLKENDENYLEKVKNSLDINKLDSIPAIIYVKDGKILNNNILTGVNNTKLKVADLEELLDIYEFETIK